MKVMKDVDSINFPELCQLIVLLRDSNDSHRNIKFLAQEILRPSTLNSSLKKDSTRLALLKLFVELFISEEKVDLSLQLLENMAADTKFLNDKTLIVYLTLVKCIKYSQIVKYELSKLCKNPFYWKEIFDKLNAKYNPIVIILIICLLTLQKSCLKI